MPTSSDFREAIQTPQIAFRHHPALQAARPRTDIFGLPVAVSGRFSTVFHLDGKEASWAIKCFLSDVSDRDRRYTAVHDMLKSIERPWKVPFEFLSDGILVDGATYPVVKMQWVEGRTLDVYLRSATAPSQLVQLGDDFIELVESLEDDGIAHGDLQHGNIIVTSSGRLRLVDYDGMFVPALHGLPAPERGHRNYQSPHRTPQDFGPGLDRHSAWVIWSSIQLRHHSPSTWDRLVSDEDLGFREADLVDPWESPPVLEMMDLEGPVRHLAHDLHNVIGQPLQRIPRLRTERVEVARRVPAWVDERLTGTVTGPVDEHGDESTMCQRADTRCQVCQSGICHICEASRDVLICSACRNPKRRPDLDGNAKVAWELGGDRLLLVGRRCSRLLTPDGGSVDAVLDEDLDNDHRVRLRTYAHSHDLPFDIGFITARQVSPVVEPLEAIVDLGTENVLKFDPNKNSHVVRSSSPLAFGEVLGEPPQVVSESKTGFSDLVVTLRAHEVPPAPGALVANRRYRRIRASCGSQGIVWSEQWESPGRPSVVVREGSEPFTTHPVSDGVVVASTKAEGVWAEIRRLNAAYMVVVGTEPDWKPNSTVGAALGLPTQQGMNLKTEWLAASVSERLGSPGALLMVPAGSVESRFAQPEMVALENRLWKTIGWEVIDNLSGHELRPISAKEIEDLLENPPTIAGDARGLSEVAADDSWDRLAIPRPSELSGFLHLVTFYSNHRETLVVGPTIEVVERWFDHALRIVRYRVAAGSPAWPPHDVTGQPLANFRIDRQRRIVAPRELVNGEYIGPISEGARTPHQTPPPSPKAAMEDRRSQKPHRRILAKDDWSLPEERWRDR